MSKGGAPRAVKAFTLDIRLSAGGTFEGVPVKDAEEKLEKSLQEQATQARASLVHEKSKAQTEGKKIVARVEREAEAR